MTKPITELKAIAEAANNLTLVACCENCDIVFDGTGEAYVACMVAPKYMDPAFSPEQRKANRRLIVEAVNALPALLARIEYLEEALARVRSNASIPHRVKQICDEVLNTKGTP